LFHLQAIRKEFLKDLPEDDREEEEAVIEALEAKKNESKLSVEERELAARPDKAGDYRRPWDAYRAACRLFKEELDALDKSTRDHNDKSTFGKRTKTAHEWFDGLSKQKKREAELAAEKWNAGGAPKHQQLA
jgi:predicted RNA-binding protein with RPS1 domain